MAVKCKYCDSTFQDLVERRKHIRKVHLNRMARTCKICNISFKTLREMKSHEVHSHNQTLEIPLDIPLPPKQAAKSTSSKSTQTSTKDEALSSAAAAAATTSNKSEVTVTAPDGKTILLYYSGWHPFSNFHTAPFFINGTCYRTVEHFYQSEKARHFEDAEKQWEILNTFSPLAAKRLGSTLKFYDPDEWHKLSEHVMAQGVREKVRQNKSVEEKLRNTGNQIIAEASPYNHFWGIGLDRNDPQAADHTRWPGFNKMGQTLMKIRDELQNED